MTHNLWHGLDYDGSGADSVEPTIDAKGVVCSLLLGPRRITLDHKVMLELLEGRDVVAGVEDLRTTADLSFVTILNPCVP